MVSFRAGMNVRIYFTSYKDQVLEKELIYVFA